MPQRIQRLRVKGARMPEGSIYVGRPGMWGNPWVPAAPCRASQVKLIGHAPAMRHNYGFDAIWGDRNKTADDAVTAYRQWLTGGDLEPLLPNSSPRLRSEAESILVHNRDHLLASLPTLRGRDLACWCPLDRPCHADVLLELSNK